MLLSEHEVSKSWHPSKNILNLANLTDQSGRKAWWVCEEGHEWECRIADRVRGKSKAGTNCPVCAGRKVLSGFNDLAFLNPEIAAEWHPTRNGELKPTDFSQGSHKKVWWLGGCGHEWQTVIKRRTLQKTGCSVCSSNQVLQGFNDLATTNPFIAKSWHPSKNGKLTPKLVTRTSHKKVWWLGECSHEWEEIISSRNRMGNCPICVGKRVLQGFNDLASQKAELVEEWNFTLNGQLLPEQVFMHLHKKVWWTCRLGHNWQASVVNRVKHNNNCPTCYGLVVAVGFNDLASQYPLVAATWHPTKNLPKTPDQAYAGGAKSYWWQCEKGHEWKTQMQSRLNKSASGTVCSTCNANNFASKSETEIIIFLKEAGYEAEQSNRKVFRNKRELDIYVPDHKLAIEYNGIYYHSEEMGKDEQYHRGKWLACKEKGITLLQIWEDDWNENSDKQKRMILKGLNSPAHIPLAGIRVDDCSNKEAAAFLYENSVGGYSLGTHKLQVKAEDDSTLAVLSFFLGLNGDCQIAFYADNLDTLSASLLNLILKEISSKHHVSYYSAVSDNCTIDHRVLELADFVRIGEIEPVPFTMKKNRRVPVSDSAEGLFYVDEFDVSHPVLKKKLIWNAGKTVWKKK